MSGPNTDTIDCPLCGQAVQQVSSATLSLALWQHVNWVCTTHKALTADRDHWRESRRHAIQSGEILLEQLTSLRAEQKRLREAARHALELIAAHDGSGPAFPPAWDQVYAELSAALSETKSS